MALYPSQKRPFPGGRFDSPSLIEILGVVAVSYLAFLGFLEFAGGSYWSLVGGNFGDNPAYLGAASAIRQWQFSGAPVKQFWGLSYAIAAVSLVTHVPLTIALTIVCVATSVISVVLCRCLWDGWIAVFFALLSFDWFQRSLLGGAEPLFMALLLGSFLALRQSRWRLATILGALATIVRPFGIFVLIGLGADLVSQKRYRHCVVATATAMLIGALYV